MQASNPNRNKPLQKTNPKGEREMTTDLEWVIKSLESAMEDWPDKISKLQLALVINHNLKIKARYHMEAEEFCKFIRGSFTGVLFDPPYSYRQVSEHYKVLGKKATQLDTSTRFYNRAMNPIAKKIKVGGIAISFGWNSNGFGKKRGFEIIEILLVAHGGHHNDTIVTVERKMQTNLNEAGK